MKTPLKTLLIATIIAVVAVAGFELIEYLFGAYVVFIVGSFTLVAAFLIAMIFQIRRINKDIKEREERWRY